MNTTTKTITAIADINELAQNARRLCTDIVRQTSLKPYYGKRGGAAFYAADDISKRQLQKIADVEAHLRAATELLVDIAIDGGTTEARVREILRQDHNYGTGQIVETPIQRSVSYGELVELSNMFDRQAEEAGVTFEDDDQRQQALLDFQQQYIDGNDNPVLRIL